MKRSALLVASALLVGGLLGAVPAGAAPTAEVIEGRMLRLVSVADWSDATRMLPGEPVQWDVEVSASTPEPGTITVAMSATGDAPLIVDAALCMTQWQESGCPGGARTLESSWSVPRDGSRVALAEFSADEVAHLRLWVALGPGEGTGLTHVRVHAHAAGESVVVDQDGALLPATGGTVAPGLLGAGAALAGIGVGLLLRRHREARGADRDA